VILGFLALRRPILVDFEAEKGGKMPRRIIKHHKETEKMSIKTTLATIKELGIKARWDAEWQEYQLECPVYGKGSTYHTDDQGDAIGTARLMAERHNTKPTEPTEPTPAEPVAQEAQEPEADSVAEAPKRRRYEWTIFRDCLDKRRVSIVGPSSAQMTQAQIKRHPEAKRFRLLDGDGTVCFYGAIVDPVRGGEFQSLDDYGTPAHGCTDIQYWTDGAWQTL
jgi:hypothetical protein